MNQISQKLRHKVSILFIGLILSSIYIIFDTREHIKNEKITLTKQLQFETEQLEIQINQSISALFESIYVIDKLQNKDAAKLFIDKLFSHYNALVAIKITSPNGIEITHQNKFLENDLFSEQKLVTNSQSLPKTITNQVSFRKIHVQANDTFLLVSLPIHDEKRRWGEITGAISWNQLTKNSLLFTDNNNRLSYTIKAKLNDTDDTSVIKQTPSRLNRSKISSSLSLENLQLVIELSSLNGWIKTGDLMFHLFSLILCLLTLSLLFSYNKNVKLQQKQQHIKSKNSAKVIQFQDSLLSLSMLNFNNYDDIIEQALREAQQILQTSRVSLWLFNNDKSAINLFSLCQEGTLSTPEITIYKADFPTYFSMIQTNSFIIANEAQNHPATTEFSKSYLIPLGIMSLLDAPVRIQGLPVGVICCEQVNTLREWTNEECNYIQGIADLCAKAILVEKQKSVQKKLVQAQHIFDNTQEGIILTDPEQNIIDVNPAFTKITGYTKKEVLGAQPSILSSGQHDRQFYETMWSKLKQNGFWTGEVWNRNKDGLLYLELLSISIIYDEFDNIINYLAIQTDITKIKDQALQNKVHIHYDYLTKLPNHTVFVDRFQQVVKKHKKNSSFNCAVCVLNLDNFKSIIEQAGINLKDQLIKNVANQIDNCLKNYQHTLSRQSGDQFNFFITGFSTKAELISILECLQERIATLTGFNGKQIDLKCCIGVAMFSEHEQNIEILLRYADQAMFKAKNMGKNQIRFYQTDQAGNNLSMDDEITSIRSAIVKDEFELYFQPKINMRSGEIIGAEALIRWNHPKKGILPPITFLPTIDGTELEIELGNWVIKTALNQLDEWQKKGIELDISINIAPIHLTSDSFVSTLKQQLNSYPNVPNQRLSIEILESSAFGDIAQISSLIEQCQQELNIQVALDDFGTGYSSLTHLRNLQTDFIKIDRSFVKDILDDAGDLSIVESIVKFAESFDRVVVAEGVENEQQGLLLLTIGCDLAQGYHIAKPMPVDALYQWLLNYEASTVWRNYSNEHSSSKERTLNIFKLLCEHWREKLFNAENQPLKPIELEKISCNCCHWLKKAKREKILKSRLIEGIEEQHTLLHNIANKMLQDNDNLELNKQAQKLFNANYQRLIKLLEAKS